MESWTRKIRRRGFNLVEIVVAFGLLSVMVAILFNLIPSSVLATVRGENKLIASNLAQNRLETLRASPFDNLDSQDGVVETVEKAALKFQIETEISEIPGHKPEYIKLAQVKVSWPERSTTQTLTYELRIFDQNR